MSCLNFIANFNETIKGSIKFHQCSTKSEVIVIFDLHNIKPCQTYACHIHEYGDTTDGCKSLGSHLNLTNKNHGTIFFDIKNSHTGDLVNNINSDKDGKVKFYYSDPRLNLFGNVVKSILGCSIVIHDGQDDYGLGGDVESLKTGNAGERMTWSVIGKAKSSEIDLNLLKFVSYLDI